MAYWTIVISVFCYVGISALTGKGYYCRDPDTGKLYPVNSTWPSSTFCGNYTCKLRKKDTAKTVVPIREILISSIPLSTKAKSAEEETMQTQETANYPASTILNTLPPTLSTEPPTKQVETDNLDKKEKEQGEESNSIELKPLSTEDGDRYLTDNEIKSISRLLYSVKKSDLEAIVDIYNLAQDIYKEMDKMTSQSILEETIKAAKTSHKSEGRKSYWYEPLSRMNKVETVTDMELHGTNLYPTAVEKSTVDPNSFFQGPLSRTDFGSLPYYYPMSSFHRDHSYVHPASSQQYPPRNEKPPCVHSTSYPYYPTGSPKGYQPPHHSYYPTESSKPYQLHGQPHPSYHPTEPPKFYQPVPPHYSYYPAQSYGNEMKKPSLDETQKVLQPSLLLPYPFSHVHHYNMTSYPYNLYYSEHPGSHFDMSNKNNEKYEQYFKAYLPHADKNAVSKSEYKPYDVYKDNALYQNAEPKAHETHKDVLNDNAELKGQNTLDENENKQERDTKKNFLGSLFEQVKIEPKKKAEWQTDPLASNVLEEIKAHFEEKARLLKPLSLRKKTKLERVGKVVKLDVLNRDKRSLDPVSSIEVIQSTEEEGFEAYMERTTCQSDMDPGFYKMGNLTQPYPACCPRKIEDAQR